VWHAPRPALTAGVAEHGSPLRGASGRPCLRPEPLGLGQHRLARDRPPLGQLGLLGAWLAMFADLHVRGLLVLRRFATGRWQHLRV
jgi:hypothetical protein